MTYDETIEAVLAKVRATDGWRVVRNGDLRRADGPWWIRWMIEAKECPVTAGTGEEAWNFGEVARKKGWDDEAVTDIAIAADSRVTHVRSAALRARLLEAARVSA